MNNVSSNLTKFINKSFNDYLRQGMSQAGALVSNEAKKKAPKDTGELRRSIEFEVSRDGLECVVYSNKEYAPYVELGTGIHAVKGNGRKKKWRYKGKDGWVTTSGNKPQPFMEPAFTENREEILRCFKGLF